MSAVDRLEVGRTFADHLHQLAREHDPNARHLSTLPTLGAVGWGTLPVVVSIAVPAAQCHLYRRGRLVAVYCLEPAPCPPKATA